MEDEGTAGIVIVGAASQIGRCLVERLNAKHRRVYALTRGDVEEKRSRNGAGVEWLRIRGGRIPWEDIRRPKYLIHLAPLPLAPKLAPGAADAGVERLVVFSSTSRFSKIDSPNRSEASLAQSLMKAEEMLKIFCGERGLAWTLFRPTLIYGLGMDNNVTLIAKVIRRFGWFPVAGRAKGLRQPVHADDLAAVCAAALDCPAARNRAYNVSGGQSLTYYEMVEAIFNGLGKRRRIVSLPPAALRLALSALSILPGMRGLTPEMADRMNDDLVFDHSDAVRDLGYSPRPFTPDFSNL